MLKRNINKFVCFILVIVMIMALSSTALAAGESDSIVEKEDSLSEEWSPKQLYLSDNGHGEYRILTNKELTASKERSATVAKLTEIDGLYQLDDKSHVYQSMDNICVAVERIDFSLTSKNQVVQMQIEYDLPKEVVQGIENRAKQYSSSNSKDDIEATLICPKNATRGTTTNYYTYNGYSIKDYIVYTPLASTKYFTVAEGSNTKNVADAVTTLVLIGGGIGNSIIGLFAGGISALQVFYNMASINYVSGHYDDYIQANISYNNWDKNTYVKHGNSWYLGCQSQRVYVKDIDTYQHYANANKKYHKFTYPKKTKKSKYFTNPASKAIYAYLNQPHVDSAIKGKYYNKIILF